MPSADMLQVPGGHAVQLWQCGAEAPLSPMICYFWLPLTGSVPECSLRQGCMPALSVPATAGVVAPAPQFFVEGAQVQPKVTFTAIQGRQGASSLC